MTAILTLLAAGLLARGIGMGPFLVLCALRLVWSVADAIADDVQRRRSS